MVVDEVAASVKAMRWPASSRSYRRAESARPGLSPKRIGNSRMLGTWWPITTRHTVRGVAMIRPIGPQSQVQNIADTMTARGDTPVRLPKNHGSIRFEVTSSTTPNRTATHSTSDQSGEMAKAIISGSTADTTDPM